MAEFDFAQALNDVEVKYSSISKAIDIDSLKSTIADLEKQAAEPGLWDDSERAQNLSLIHI